jgi:hypothetical protein
VSRTQQLTLRGLDRELQRKISDVANEDGTSLNQAVLKLLRRATGLELHAPNPRAIGNAYDDLIGTWSVSESQKFDEAVKVLNVIDEDMWR